MARKDFDKYFKQVYNQYMQMQQVLKDISNEVATSMTEPSKLEELKKTIAPIEANYRNLCYIKYILDKPVKKNKVNNYNKRAKKLILESKGYTEQDIIGSNQQAINKISNF